MGESKAPDNEAKQRDLDEEMGGMRFRFVKIQFYPEDLAKMETMDHNEKMEFVKRLRQENRYVEADD